MRLAWAQTCFLVVAALACQEPDEEPLDCGAAAAKQGPVCEEPASGEFPALDCPAGALFSANFSGPLDEAGFVVLGGNWETCDGHLSGGSGTSCPGSIRFQAQTTARFGDGVAIDLDVRRSSPGSPFGVLWTMQDVDHGQLAWFGADGASLTQNAASGGVMGSGTEYVEAPFEAQMAHHVRVELQAGMARLIVDGAEVGAAPTQFEEGAVGLWSYLGVVQFDNLCVTAL